MKDPDIKGKFTIRTWDGINMGPAQGRDRYKIYDSSTKCMSVTCDVHFLEGRAKPEIFRSPLLKKQEKPIPDFKVDGSGVLTNSMSQFYPLSP